MGPGGKTGGRPGGKGPGGNCGNGDNFDDGDDVGSPSLWRRAMSVVGVGAGAVTVSGSASASASKGPGGKPGGKIGGKPGGMGSGGNGGSGALTSTSTSTASPSAWSVFTLPLPVLPVSQSGGKKSQRGPPPGFRDCRCLAEAEAEAEAGKREEASSFSTLFFGHHHGKGDQQGAFRGCRCLAEAEAEAGRREEVSSISFLPLPVFPVSQSGGKIAQRKPPPGSRACKEASSLFTPTFPGSSQNGTGAKQGNHLRVLRGCRCSVEAEAGKREEVLFIFTLLLPILPVSQSGGKIAQRGPPSGFRGCNCFASTLISLFTLPLPLGLLPVSQSGGKISQRKPPSGSRRCKRSAETLSSLFALRSQSFGTNMQGKSKMPGFRGCKSLASSSFSSFSLSKPQYCRSILQSSSGGGGGAQGPPALRCCCCLASRAIGGAPIGQSR